MADKFDTPAAYAALKSGALVYATTRSDIVVGKITELRVGFAGAEYVCVRNARGIVWVEVGKVRLATDEEVRDANG